MRITFLGKVAAGGIPLYGCGCATFAREPCFALIESGTTRILIDSGRICTNAWLPASWTPLC